MAVRTIITEGDPRLRQKSLRMRTVDDEVRRLAQDLWDTVRAARGLGLAAPQIGVLRRIIVVSIPPDYVEEGDPGVELTLINPEIVRASGRQVGLEGCLSIPGWYGEVPRFMHVTVKALDLDGREVRIKGSGLLARVLQHEIDHLDGILFIDRIEDRSTLRYIPDEEEEESVTAAAS
ncbi:peptide deformylase [Thermomicrobium sp. CFH 73360]|uniref:peptide deformylase n=1 Tax=Thermomicrobium sp. CFH 73360 TaxID=2951987 RepID=UPI0020775502|nr:peptide deformylase [Thermomicrobium sp. CFH 73360]MCM8746027.1 peptide deformylase [Thermomicrobium sp. CFH 73360]